MPVISVAHVREHRFTIRPPGEDMYVMQWGKRLAGHSDRPGLTLRILFVKLMRCFCINILSGRSVDISCGEKVTEGEDQERVI